MSRKIRIEVQDQFGRWNKLTTVADTASSIKLGLERALKTQLAAKSKKARAVDDKTGAMVDILSG